MVLKFISLVIVDLYLFAFFPFFAHYLLTLSLSSLVAAGSAFVRSMPELNTEQGLQAAWDAFEQFIFPRIYDSLFPLIVRKVCVP